MRFDLVRTEVRSESHVERWEAIQSFDARSPYDCFVERLSSDRSDFSEDHLWSMSITRGASRGGVDELEFSERGASKEELIELARRSTGHDIFVMDDIETVNGEPVGSYIIDKMKEADIVGRR